MPPTFRILIVEDDMTILVILRRMLAHFAPGAVITSCSDSETATQRLRDNPPHLLITDINMTGLNGIDLVKLAVALPQPLRIIVITAYHTPETERQARTAGAHTYMTKPVDFDRLEREVHLAMQGRSGGDGA